MAKKRQVDEIIDVRFFVFKLINNWYYFLISILLSLSIAFGINRYSQEIFESSTTLLIKEKIGTMQSAAEMLYDNRYGKVKRGLKNEEIILKSSPLIYETVKELGFDISYYVIGNIKTTETYEDVPFKIVKSASSIDLAGESFVIEFIDDKRFKIIEGGNVKSGSYDFGDEILIKGTKIRILAQFQNTKTALKDLSNYLVRFNSLQAIANQYRNKLNVPQSDKEATVLKLAIQVV